jgi:cellobiose phosphorylase
MNVMLAFALYSRGFAEEGWQVIRSLFELSLNQKSGIYPCIPEYFDLEAKGLYPYLTGSASWLSYLFLTQILGIGFSLGALVIEPRLLNEQFRGRRPIKVRLKFSKKDFTLIIKKSGQKNWPDYRIKKAAINGKSLKVPPQAKRLNFKRPALKRLLQKPKIKVEITLG